MLDCEFRVSEVSGSLAYSLGKSRDPQTACHFADDMGIVERIGLQSWPTY